MVADLAGLAVGVPAPDGCYRDAFLRQDGLYAFVGSMREASGFIVWHRHPVGDFDKRYHAAIPFKFARPRSGLWSECI